MGQLEVRGAGAIPFVQRMLSNDIDRIDAGQAQYTLLLRRATAAHRRPDRLPVRRRPRPAGRERVATVDADRDWLAAHVPGDVRARRSLATSIALLALQGPDALRLVELAGAAAVRLRRRRGVRRARDRRPHRLHRRARRRAHGRRREGRAAVGRARRRRRRRRPGWARATRCASRCATRSTATTWTTPTPPSRRASAGCAPSRPRTSSAPTRSAPRRRPAATTGSSRCGSMGRGHPAPGHVHAAGRRGHERHDVAVARDRHRDGLRPRRPGRGGHRDRDRRPRPARRRARGRQAPVRQGDGQ